MNKSWYSQVSLVKKKVLCCANLSTNWLNNYKKNVSARPSSLDTNHNDVMSFVQWFDECGTNCREAKTIGCLKRGERGQKKKKHMEKDTTYWKGNSCFKSWTINQSIAVYNIQR